jgi:hypothetical protein
MIINLLIQSKLEGCSKVLDWFDSRLVSFQCLLQSRLINFIIFRQELFVVPLLLKEHVFSLSVW